MKDLKALVRFVDNLIKDKIRAMGLLGALSRIAYYNEVLRYIASQLKELNFRPAFKCFAQLSLFYLDPKGNVYPCTLLGIKLGNLREKHQGRYYSLKIP